MMRPLAALAALLLTTTACVLGAVGDLSRGDSGDAGVDPIARADAAAAAGDGGSRADGSSEAADAAGADASGPDAGPRIDAGSADASSADAGADSGWPRFSFFVTSLKAMQALSGNAEGFGGDLRFGETGPGAGLRGADKICAAVAERSMPGSSAKQWRAFLSVTADENGKQVNAMDRIGNGPWYDRLGRLFANNTSELMDDRPQKANSVIKNDFPNEDGVPNHNPDLTGNVDNHDFLTGSDAQGRLYDSSATCKDWTTSDGSAANGRPRVGHSWPTGGMMGFPGGGGGSMANWMSALDEAGCAPDVYLVDDGAAKPWTNGVGSGGGYGGIYCFALEP